MALAAAVVAAAGCEDDDEVARLADRSGEVRAQDEEGAAWEEADVGRMFQVGGAVETGAGASARVELIPAGGLRLGANSRVRFGRGERRLGLEIGGAEIEAGEESFSVFTEFGEAEIEPSSRVAVRVEDGQLRFDVLVGSATIEERGGPSRSLLEGESIAVGVETGIEPPADAAAPRAEVPADAAPPGVTASISGDGARIRDADGAWARLEAGRRAVPIGAEISLDRSSSIELARGDARARIRGKASLTVGGPGEPIAVTRRGRARVSAGADDVVLEVPGGAIIARGGAGGSRAAVEVGGSGETTVEAGRGRVAVEGERGRAALSAGERATVARDGRVRTPRELPPRELPPPPEVADFSIAAGESPTVHAPSPPVAIRIRYRDACAGEGVVELARDRGFSRLEMVAEGRGAGIVRAVRGRRYYRVRCLEDGEPGGISARGALRVRRNSGSAPLPERPPHTRLEADGRRYTVHYQNLLPRLTFSWPDAPTDDLHLRVIAASGKKRRVAAPGGERTVSSGSLREGEYKWWFQAADDEAIRSPKTSLVITFDNAADSAHLRAPGVRESWNRSAVRVRGVTLKGWRVSVGERHLATDDQRRFSARVSVPANERALAIRFAHPRRGVHYYVRRPGGG